MAKEKKKTNADHREEEKNVDQSSRQFIHTIVYLSR
jgi:hypothetical protein